MLFRFQAISYELGEDPVDPPTPFTDLTFNITLACPVCDGKEKHQEKIRVYSKESRELNIRTLIEKLKGSRPCPGDTCGVHSIMPEASANRFLIEALDKTEGMEYPHQKRRAA